MKRILIATPLYPPDIAGAAPYVKELAARLSKEYEITILAYGHIPEKVEGVNVVTVEKQQPVVVRLSEFTQTLFRLARQNDIVYVQNGPSTELPTLVVSFFTRTPIIIGQSDTNALSLAQKYFFLNALQKLVMRRAKKVVDSFPHVRPEILPFVPYPEEAFRAYEQSWREHIEELTKLFWL